MLTISPTTTEIQDEGIIIGNVRILDFTGAGVTASISGDKALVNITSSSSSITADNGLTANTATNIQLGGTLLQNTNIDYSGFNLILEGTGFNDSVAIYDGGIDLSVGDANRHAFMSLAKLATGSSFQAFLDSTGNVLFGEIEGITNDVASTGMWNIYMQETGVFYSNLLLDETGAFLRAGTTLATAKGIFIDLAGTPYLDVIANDDTETKILTWNSTDKKVEYREASTLGGGLTQQQVEGLI